MAGVGKTQDGPEASLVAESKQVQNKQTQGYVKGTQEPTERASNG